MINLKEHYCISIISENSQDKYIVVEKILEKFRNHKKVFYFFANIFNIINYFNIENINKEIRFISYNGIEDIISFVTKNRFNKNSIIILDNISILNLEISNNIIYFVRLNMLLSYIHMMCDTRDSIAIFLLDIEKEPIANLVNYWCDYQIVIREMDKEIILRDFISEHEEKINYEELKKWMP